MIGDIESVILAKFREEAEQKGYDAYLCESADIPRGAIHAYAPLTDTEKCLQFIADSVAQGYAYTI